MKTRSFHFISLCRVRCGGQGQVTIAEGWGRAACVSLAYVIEAVSGSRLNGLNPVAVAKRVTDRWGGRVLEEQDECTPELDGTIWSEGSGQALVRRKKGQGPRFMVAST
ncbi:hypothetical protein MRX96_049228 [Rhipicephalus microplus]